MKHSKWTFWLEWLLVVLIIATVMGFGAIRMHQLALNAFLLASFGIILALMLAYGLVYHRFFLPENEETAPEDCKEN